MPTPPLLLASSSPYRHELLTRLGIGFRTVNPAVDETPQDGETPEHLAIRLARAKARSVANDHGGSVVIGSDQVATRGGSPIGKPGNHEAARQQLLESSDQKVTFYTGVCVVDTVRGLQEHHLDQTRVHFRSLHSDEIERYLEAERPYDCAGAFKAEGLGISLFWRVSNEDPTALHGLPLIWLASALRRAGYAIP